MYNLTCISNELKDQGIGFKSMTWKRFDQLQQADAAYALYELGSRWLNNVIVTKLHLKHCIGNSWGYRVSSSLFPCLTHPDADPNLDSMVPQRQLILDELNNCRQLIHDIMLPIYQAPRVCTHPDQFNVLASDNQSAVNETIKELNVHGWLLDQLGCPRDYSAPINIHVNRTKGDLGQICDLFIANLSRCHESVISRLVVENEDKGCWTVNALYDHFYAKHSIPITFDNLHFKCNPDEGIDEYGAMAKCASTWGSHKPLFHYSESHPDKPNPRAHADMPTGSPPDFPADWDIELKSKDQAVRACAILFGEKQLQQVPIIWEII
ncbi:hypothetical protein N9045_01070 [bacterium]|nr:hypothetical protein [bacterium]